MYSTRTGYLYDNYFNLGMDELEWYGDPYSIKRNGRNYSIFIDPEMEHDMLVVAWPGTINWESNPEVEIYKLDYRHQEKFKLDRFLSGQDDICERRIEDLLRNLGL